jgi:hypothetical protein
MNVPGLYLLVAVVQRRPRFGRKEEYGGNRPIPSAFGDNLKTCNPERPHMISKLLRRAAACVTISVGMAAAAHAQTESGGLYVQGD